MDESNSERILQGHWSARRRLKLRTWIIGKSEVQISKKNRYETKRVPQLSTGAGQKIPDHPEVTYLVDGQDYHSWSDEFNDERTVVNTTQVITSSAPRSGVQRTLARVQWWRG